MEAKNKIFVTWAEIDEMIQQLAEKIVASGNKYTVIIGIPRGGLIPAVILSHKLSIPMMTNKEWEEDNLYIGTPNENILVVDDICDTGETLKEWNERNFSTVVLFQKHEDMAKIQTTYHARFMDYHELHNIIVFPWEDKNATTYVDYKK